MYKKMKLISSRENQLFKKVKKLRKKKYRDKFHEYCIEGPNLIREALNRGIILKNLIVNEEYLCKKEIVDLIENNEVYSFSKELFEDIAETISSQGILAVVDMVNLSKAVFIEKMKNHSKNILVIDEVQDPGNLGTMIRTSVGAGFGGIIIVKGTVDMFSPKVVRVCAGSQFITDVFFAESAVEAIEIIKIIGRQMVTTEFDAQRYYHQVDFSGNKALVVGNEGNGLSGEFLQSDSIAVKIPMEENLESLNVAVAAGIIMYETLRQRLDKI